MANFLAVTTLVLGLLGFSLLCISTGTTSWKEDIDFWKDQRIYMGLWRMCYENRGTSQAKFPAYYECDKDFLRPLLQEPPSWFNSVRALMLLSILGSGFGILFFMLAFVTDNSKKTGSKYWPSGVVMFFGGICALVGLSVFARHMKEGVQFAYGGGVYFAEYWTSIAASATVNGVAYKIETWLRWSYGVGWGGVAFTFFALVCSVLCDLTRKIY